MNRVDVQPALLRWARERPGRSIHELRRRFPKLDVWERGEVLPTLKQLKTFANTTHTPIGTLRPKKTSSTRSLENRRC